MSSKNPKQSNVLLLSLFEDSNAEAASACDRLVAGLRERDFRVTHDELCRSGLSLRRPLRALHKYRAIDGSILIYAEGRIAHQAGMFVLGPTQRAEGVDPLEVGVPLRSVVDAAFHTLSTQVTIVINPFADEVEIEHGRFFFRNAGGGYECGSKLLRNRLRMGMICGAGEPHSNAAKRFRDAAFELLLDSPHAERHELSQALADRFREEGASYLTAATWQNDEVLTRVLG